MLITVFNYSFIHCSDITYWSGVEFRRILGILHDVMMLLRERCTHFISLVNNLVSILWIISRRWYQYSFKLHFLSATHSVFQIVQRSAILSRTRQTLFHVFRNVVSVVCCSLSQQNGTGWSTSFVYIRPSKQRWMFKINFIK
jgi:hypothetical protein